ICNWPLLSNSETCFLTSVKDFETSSCFAKTCSKTFIRFSFSTPLERRRKEFTIQPTLKVNNKTHTTKPDSIYHCTTIFWSIVQKILVSFKRVINELKTLYITNL